jgi:NitT/TauT family transport system substrate-binding protein
MRVRRISAALFCFVVLLGAGPALAADPVTIREGWVAITSVLLPLVFEKKEVMQHYGTSYVVAPQHFESSSAQLTALATGDLDISIGGPITLGNAVENARLDDIRVIGDGFQDGVQGYFSSRYLVREDSPIRTIDDLRGKVLVANGIGGTMDVVIRAAMGQHKMIDKRDYTLLEAEFAAMNSMLLEGKVDLISSIPPFAYDPRLDGKSRILFTMHDIIGPSQMVIMFARERFLEAHRAAMIDYFEDALRGVRWFLDPANRDAMLDIVARATKAPRERFAGFLYTQRDYYHAPDLHPNAAAMQHDIDTLRGLGYVKSPLDVRHYLDLSYVEAAEKRL